MENEITAHRAGKVTSLNVKEGDAVGCGDTLADDRVAATPREGSCPFSLSFLGG